MKLSDVERPADETRTLRFTSHKNGEREVRGEEVESRTKFIGW